MSKLSRTVGFIASALVLSLIVAGCGVSQPEVDAIVANRDALTAQVADLLSELDTTTQQRDTLATSSEETKQELSTLTSSEATLQLTEVIAHQSVKPAFRDFYSGWLVGCSASAQSRGGTSQCSPSQTAFHSRSSARALRPA